MEMAKVERGSSGCGWGGKGCEVELVKPTCSRGDGRVERITMIVRWIEMLVVMDVDEGAEVKVWETVRKIGGSGEDTEG